MIPRYQRNTFYTLCVLIILMAAFTIRERQKSHDRIAAATEALPYIEPVNAQTESVTLDLANDANGSIISGLRDTALPQEPSSRAHALLDRLFAEYAQPNSPHPIRASQNGQVVDDVFLLKLPIATQPSATFIPSGLLAVVNLRAAFVDAHPSGVTVENLTIQSIIGTLHANLPDITEIRFLVDGQPRETLAGHADLTHTYPAVDTAATSLQPTQPAELPHP
ncbi:GerMN domain-containing protein [Granulicella arctica]|uniref:GerMN domain-containing protein n=1 Tax=Granulicella arctica TaxID=940613 RepID=UPI0021E05934|nr:GerMN domain-containing protein [Granulicella arctica]